MASKPTTPEPSSLSLRAAPVKTEKNYPSRKWIAKLALSDVVANLLEIGTAEIRRIKIHNDQPEPFQEHPLTVDEEFTRRLARYDSLARHELFCIGVQGYVAQLDLATIEKELRARNLSTGWSDRTDTRTAKEKALVSDILKEK